MILKGQNFRILIFDSTASKFKCVGMATNCVVTLTSNTEDASHKDITGLASKPTVASKSWQVQVDSLNVQDVGAMMTAIKNLTQFTLLWDETSTTDNQNPLGESFARSGQAYLSDATFTFNDRENSTKNLTFTGTSRLQSLPSEPEYEAVTYGVYTKGQFVRLFLSSDNSVTPNKVIGSAKQLSIHFSLSMEDSTTKDTEGDWQIQEPTALTYDITSQALVKSNETISSSVQAQGLSDLETIYESSGPVQWLIANVSGDNNRTKGAVICSGSCIIQTLTINSPNRQNATYQAQLSGYGDFSVGS